MCFEVNNKFGSCLFGHLLFVQISDAAFGLVTHLSGAVFGPVTHLSIMAFFLLTNFWKVHVSLKL